MKTATIVLLFCISILLMSGCSGQQSFDKGFPVSPETQSVSKEDIHGIYQDSISIKTRPGSVLLSAFPEYRLTPIYKLNFNKSDEHYFTGSNYYYRNYSEIGYTQGNQWHYNFMPGLNAVYGYNMVNVALKDVQSQKQTLLFDKHVLIKTLYIPSISKDTLNQKPVKRNYYLVSVYDEDTNNDAYISQKDLRRFYLFDLDGNCIANLVPENYSVISSQYDYANDMMYVYAQLDENKNGQREETEPVHIFWIDLNNPDSNGQQYN